MIFLVVLTPIVNKINVSDDHERFENMPSQMGIAISAKKKKKTSVYYNGRETMDGDPR